MMLRGVGSLDGEYWFRSLKCPILASRSFIVCVWRQWSSDQDDHKGKKPYNETCFQNPQSCSWLVVWYNQFGLQDPNQIHKHQERADQRLKQNHKDVLLPAHLQKPYPLGKESGLILSQKIIRPSIVQCRNNWALFFVMDNYFEKKMERSNSGD